MHFKTVCLPALKKKDEPLIVVDGIIYESNELKKINPDEIESISVLKDSGLIFSCRPPKEVIVITTKKAHKKNFIVKDSDERTGIASATMIAVSEYKKDTVTFVADEFGRIETFKLKAADYKLRISCAGYKTKEISLKEAALYRYEILLEKDEIELREVCVVGYTTIICRHHSCCGCISKVSIGSLSKSSSADFVGKPNGLNIFPNPVKAGVFVNIQLPDQMPVEFSVRLISASGQQVILNENEIKFSGRQPGFQLKTQLSAGVYFVQLVSKNKKIVSTGKIILL
ncbi:MAG: T9SS type A sorting domain-containing protein [Lacibacter sp.]